MPMRAIVFFIFFILFGGTIPSYSLSYNNLKDSSFKNILEKKHQKFTDEINDFTLLDYTYVDVEEEYSCDEDSKENSKNNYCIEKHTILLKLYSSNTLHYISNHRDIHFNIFLPPNGNSLPIYITQRVLRI